MTPTLIGPPVVPGRPPLRFAGMSAVWRPRAALAAGGLAVLCLATVVVGLGMGDYAISPARVIEVLFGGGSSLDRTVVLGSRLPRVVGGVIVGAALGIAGALTQSIARNALASPDVLGITEGASAMAVTIIVAGTVLGGGGYGAAAPTLSGVGIPLAAFAGALTVTAAIWLLAWRRGVDPFRLVLIGIAVSALLQAYIIYLMAASDLRDAAAARTWLSGSLSGASWSGLAAVALCVAVAMGLFGWMAFRLSVLQLGPATASALGGRVQLSLVALLLVAVALAASSVAAAGPIGFVAFVAPQLALRLAGVPSPPLATSAAAGAALVTVADVIARGIAPWELPVGIVTSAIGAPFLIHLLIRSNRRTSA
ncbi:FecCD family ABC transporter permease [Corynebacterium freneyi]|uniref:Iron ABC transporter n=2 Tax=Corynebacterium freneyi TaxID=134034 RepID=A0A095Y0L5_9CORY|nr:iron ABC transporter permease [Corynebacterium freneyi]KGF15995.1 iron ABC transporter [Corynebacterium freneyi DNF00450]MBP2332850.1 iron complex transport system permease protein [Corynebacterium freneyi]MDK8767253.1 iron ABC transporter permease [Corynebacterium freneyi]QXA53020.1 iron ABC transporter permease [Corynebacterium freneyi]WJZ05045.1 putative siderophore transport system permease protein YfhA [Corynebacterium freneyi]